MKLGWILFCIACGFINESSSEIESTATTVSDYTTVAGSSDAKQTSLQPSNDSVKDKRQIIKDTSIYSNHRTPDDKNKANRNSDMIDDPENGQETIYNAKTQQFLIRPIAPHQHHQHESHQEPQLRNYPTTIRPHASQLLQSQEVQHFAYLQDISRNHPKYAVQVQGEKSHAVLQQKKQGTNIPPQQYHYDNAEQSYNVALQSTSSPAPSSPPLLSNRAYLLQADPGSQLQHQPLSLEQKQQNVYPPQRQHQKQQQPQQYQIVPEEQFLKLIEEELQMRAYHDASIHEQQQQEAYQHQQQPQHNQRQHQQQHPQHPQHQQQVQQQQHRTTHKYEEQHEQQERLQPAVAESTKILHPSDLNQNGLGNYRQRVNTQQQPEYLQFIPQHRGGPKYLPLQNKPTQQTQATLANIENDDRQLPLQQIQQAQLPPQTAYFQPQVSYKTLPNHPLAKSSLEKEIEKLLASNKPSPASTAAVQIIDNSNEPSTAVNQHELHPTRPAPRPIYHAKSYSSSTTPNSLLDANNHPFIPSLFKFSNYQEPTQIFPTQIPQHVIDAKKLGPVVYPTQPATQREQTASTQAQQPTHNVYQETAATEKPKSYRSKQFGIKLPTAAPQKFYEKSTADPKYSTSGQYYQYNSEPQQQQQQQHTPEPVQFYPSPPDPLGQQQQPTSQPQKYTVTAPISLTHQPQQASYRQYSLPQPVTTNSPHPPPSQSSIFVAQGTGIATPSRPTTHKPKTAEDVRQLHLPAPGGKPLTQAEFQSLVDAGYPVTAVPVPVPIPFEQYIHDHPDYRSRPIDYAKLMRFSSRQFVGYQQRPIAAPSEPSVRIVSTQPEQQTATGIGGGSITYLRPIVGEQKRRTRNEKDTKIPEKPVDFQSNPVD